MDSMTRTAFPLLLVAVFAVACGGGGGTDPGDGRPASVDGSVDTVRPTVSYVAPSNNDVDVAINTKVTATFSEAMGSASAIAAFSLTDVDSGTAVPVQSVDYDVLNKILTLTPQGTLGANRLYQATVSTAAKDLSDNALAADYSWTFRSSAKSDLTPPTVTSSAPANGAIGVGTNTAVAVSFSEAIDAGTLRGAFSLSEGVNAVAGFTTYIGQAAVFNPTSPLSASTTYTATVSTAAKDLAGNVLETNYVWRFTTGATADLTPPSVISVIPLPSTTGVARNTIIAVTFDRAIYPFVYGAVDGLVIPVSIDFATNTVTMRPTAPLRATAGYNTSITARSVAGSTMTSPYVWGFATGP